MGERVAGGGARRGARLDGARDFSRGARGRSGFWGPATDLAKVALGLRLSRSCETQSPPGGDVEKVRSSSRASQQLRRGPACRRTTLCLSVWLGWTSIALLAGCVTSTASRVALAPSLAAPEVRAAAEFLRGQSLELDGRLADAAQAYADAAELDPTSVELQRYLSRVWIRAGHPDRATPFAERALELEPEDPGTRRALAELYTSQRRYLDAAELLEPWHAAGELGPKDLRGLFRLYLESDRLDDARGVANELIETEPESVDGFVALGGVHERAQNWDAAEAVYRAAVEVAPKMGVLYSAVARLRARAGDAAGEEAIWDQKLAVIPGDPQALSRLSELKEQRGDLLGAIRDLDVLLTAHPDQLQGALQRAYLLSRSGRYEESIASFSGVAQEHPELHEVRYFLGLVQQQAGHGAAALESLRSVPQGNDRYADARRLMAGILEDRGQLDQALAILDQAAEKAPEDPELQLYRATLLQKSGRSEDAEALVRSLMAKDPDEPDLVYQLGLLQGEAGDEDTALATMRQVLEMSPDHASALNYLGYTLAERGEKLDEAERLIRRALTQRPEDGYITDSLGWVLYQRALKALAAGEADRARESVTGAVAALERAVELTDPDDPTITRHLADAYRAVSRFGESLAAYQRALELDPEAKEAGSLREQIRMLEIQLGRATDGGSE